ncbi:hypothetical protein KXD93_01385 [Mucilaginibacter sp. BJC16-A38]|uniref:hypothetical protein n=1 Tax=Mucilaginibacter phenanthrenivorans TaxID=1234842 RepID=UPI0021574A4C|nr:hypothetical protein [Mucilaginibacter phenanthrenivorans]MCR8556273.1 hypothetical protein [Mucilaginibacter phenanthrenivorans]
MKTSIKLTIAAVLLMVTSMVFYDLMLRKSFLSGIYKDQFNDYVTLDFKDFNAIKLGASTAVNVIVKQGAFSVRIDPIAKEYTIVKQVGKTLYIDTAFPGGFLNARGAYVMTITCPDLKRFDADAIYMAGDRQITDTLASEDFKWRPTIISGFTLDSLRLFETHASSIILQQNNIGAFTATVGLAKGSRSDLTILEDNQLKKASLIILNRSQLQLREAAIQNLDYQIADSAKLILTGAATKSLIKK